MNKILTILVLFIMGCSTAGNVPKEVSTTDSGIDDPAVVEESDCGLCSCEPGAQGEQGEPGPAGRDGVNGRDGVSGVNGKDGKDGIDGVNGVNGKDGVSDIPGPQGLPGIQGLQGLPGVKGDTGSTGARGATGATGPQGPAGRDGVLSPLYTVKNPNWMSGSAGNTGYHRMQCSARCDPGDIIMSGGCQIYYGATMDNYMAFLVTSMPQELDNGVQSWHCEWAAGGTPSGATSAYAICIDVGDDHIP